jgi:23S rRNA pseudouridine1911/1915/1917 synthase
MTDSEQSKLIISSPPALADLAEESEGAGVEFREVSIPLDIHGGRLDRALAELVPEFSRSYLQQLIVTNAVELNGRLLTKAAARVKAGDRLKIELKPTAQSQAFKPEAIPLAIVFEDEYLIVINKPPGLVVHPAPGNWSGTLLNGLLSHDIKASVLPRAGIVHRLDKDTSGLMVVARQRQIMDQLVCMIAARELDRQYIAWAHGAWAGPPTVHVDLPVGRDPRNRLKMAVVNMERNPGKTASTDIMVLQSVADYCLVRCKLHTGRTHQIRVHMAALKHPLVSDELYGGWPAGGLTRQALHAFSLAFRHPATGEALHFTSSLPADMRTSFEKLGLSYN